MSDSNTPHPEYKKGIADGWKQAQEALIAAEQVHVGTLHVTPSQAAKWLAEEFEKRNK